MTRRMLVSFALAFALVLALSLHAAAAPRTYVGGVEPRGDVAFQLKASKKKGTRKEGGKRRAKVKNFRVEGVPISCDGEPERETARLRITLAIDVERRRFRITALNDERTSSFRVRGKVRKGGRRASGTIRATGAVRLDDDSLGTNCDTGVLRWSAARQASG